MPERQRSDQVNLKNHRAFTPKSQEYHGLSTDCYFWPTFSFSNELWGQTFLIAWNRGRIANSTATEARTQMTTKATGLCAKSRRAVDGGVSCVQNLPQNLVHKPVAFVVIWVPGFCCRFRHTTTISGDEKSLASSKFVWKGKSWPKVAVGGKAMIFLSLGDKSSVFF